MDGQIRMLYINGHLGVHLMDYLTKRAVDLITGHGKTLVSTFGD